MKKTLLFILFLISSTSLVSAQYSINGEIVRSKILDSKTFYVEYLYEGKTVYNINGTEYSGETIKNLYFTNNFWFFDKEDTQKGVYSTVINGIEYFRDRQSIVFSPDKKHFGYIYKDSFYIDGVNTNIESKYGYDTLVIDNLGNYLLKKGTVGSSTTISLLGKSYNVLKSDFLLASIKDGKLIYLFSTVEGDTIFNGDSKGKLGSLMSGGVSDDGKNVISTYRDKLENQKVYVSFKLVDSYSNIQGMIIDNLGNYKVIYVSRESNKLVYKYKDNTQDVVLKQVDSFSYSKCIQKGQIYNLINGTLYLDNKQIRDGSTFLGESTQGCYYTDSKGNSTLESTKYGSIDNLSYNGDYFYSSSLGKLYSNQLEYNVGQNLTNLVLNGDKFYIQSNDKININGTVYNLQINNKVTVSEDGLLAGYLEGKTYIIKSLSSIIKVGDSKSITGLSIEQTKDDTVTGESGENPNFEIINRENKLNKASLDKIINTNQLIVNKIEINGYQGYPYTEKQPSYEQMNEVNSYIINYKLPKGYNLLSVDAGKEFIVKLDKVNSRYYITPTTERVLREIYLDTSEDYTVTYYYQQGINKPKKIEIKGNIKYVYGFNFERDAFSLYNSNRGGEVKNKETGQVFSPGKFDEIRLGHIILLFPYTEVYDENDKKISIKDLLQNDKYKLTQLEREQLNKYNFYYRKKKLSDSEKKILVMRIFAKYTGLYQGYCLGFGIKGYNYTKKDSPLNEWINIKKIYDITSTSQFSGELDNFNIKYGENLNGKIQLIDLLAKDWLKQKLSSYKRIPFIMPNDIKLLPLRVSLQTSGHIILGYKLENYKNIDKFKIDGDTKKIVYYDKNNDGKFTKDECLESTIKLCRDETESEKFKELKNLNRIYVYDNSNPIYDKSSIFIYNISGQDEYTLNTMKDFVSLPIEELKIPKWENNPNILSIIK